MLLPSRLSATTLGDVLGSLHRAQISGVLELSDPAGVVHRVHLKDGLIAEVQSPMGRRLGDIARETCAMDDATCLRLERAVFAQPTKRVGDALVETQVVSPQDLSHCLKLQTQERLEALYALPDAGLRFRVANPRRPTAGDPLVVSEFLHGRTRRRQARRPPATEWRQRPVAERLGVAQAFEALGLPPNAERASIRAAFRRRAAAVHPDRYTGPDETRRQELQAEFVRLTTAYRTLVA